MDQFKRLLIRFCIHICKWNAEVFRHPFKNIGKNPVMLYHSILHAVKRMPHPYNRYRDLLFLPQICKFFFRQLNIKIIHIRKVFFIFIGSKARIGFLNCFQSFIHFSEDILIFDLGNKVVWLGGK